MKKSTLILISFFMYFNIFAQNITGNRSGILNVQGTQLTLVFNILKNDTGYSATMASPDQKVFGVRANKTTYENSILKIEIEGADIVYEGTLNAENIVVGTFKQHGQSFPLDLSTEKVEKQKIVRPQDPIEPYPYYSEDVTFENENAKITLAGTLTLPRKDGKFPVVILITGSGPQNRNEELMGHKPFLVISDYLTRNGIAVLRYDDRGTAESKGDFKTATTLDFAGDAEAAVKYLKTRKEIDPKNIGLIGHSEGGMIAPMVAAKSKDIAFIVLLAGPGIPIDELLSEQQNLIGKASGISEQDLQKSDKINKTCYDLVKKSTNAEALKTDLTNYLKKVYTEFPESEKPKGITENEFVSATIEQLTNPWMLFFIKYDPPSVLKNVKCPVLALNGDKDLQVYSKTNLPAIKKSMELGGNKDITTIEFPGLNHLFQECETGLPEEYSKIEQTFSPKALAEILSWIQKNVKN